MYGVPESDELAFLKGRRIASVTFTETTVQFRIDEQPTASITIEGHFRHIDHVGEVSEGEPTRKLRVCSLLRLIGTTIAAAEGENADVLKMYFSNGDVLEILDRDRHFEACQIFVDGRLLVI